MNRLTKIKITNLNPHVICVLCGGYYINATTIVECLHSFCRTCITRYLETSKYCPVCDVMVHKTRPLEYIRSDKTLQDLVYKLVPGLYKSEMKRRREYYAQHDESGVSKPPSEDRGTEFHDRIIYTEDEKISLSLELCAEGIPFKTPSSVHGHSGPENIRISDVRFLSCPAAFSIGNLKKFIRMKFDLKLKYEIDIFHTAEPLPDYYTLMDIAYIYTWTRRAPLRLYYTVYECKIPRKIPEPICRVQERTVDADKITVVEKHISNACIKSKTVKSKKENKKRKLLDGPDDIVPDFEGEKSPVTLIERRKDTVVQRKRQKKAVLAVVDSSVLEAMSESEEQLAKLTLDCSKEFGNVLVDTGGDSSSQSDSSDNNDTNMDCDKDIKSVDKTEIGVDAEKNADSCDNENMPKSRISPELISLSLFQPLIAIESENVTKSTNNDTVFDFVNDTIEKVNGAPIKPRGTPGRKKLTTKNGKKCDGAILTDGKDANLMITGNDPGTTEGPQKKKPGRKKKCEVLTNVETGDGAKAKTKSVKNVNSETGERVKRKYVRKADKVDKSDSNVKQTPKKGRKPKQVDAKDEQKKSKQTPEVITETKDNVGEKPNVQEKGTDVVNSNPQCDVNNRNKTIANDTNSKLILSDTSDIKQTENTSHCQVSSPSTPLYGQTPKETESNQGLPVSLNPDCAEKIVTNTICESLGKVGNDTCVKESGNGAPIVQSNSVSEKVVISTVISDAAPVEYFPNGAITNDELDTKLVIDESTGVENGYQAKGVINNGSEHYRSGEIMTPLYPVQDAVHNIVDFQPNSPGPQSNNQHPLGNVFTQMDQSSDQPLDLTSNGRREEYMKGKIFKTKMLKRTFTKPDLGLSQKDKFCSPPNNVMYPHGWT